MLAWQRARPGERLLEVDVPLSYGMVDVCQPSPSNNSVEFMWDPTKEVGIYIKVRSAPIKYFLFLIIRDDTCDRFFSLYSAIIYIIYI